MEIDRRMQEFDRCDETLIGLLIGAGFGLLFWAAMLWVWLA